MQHQISMILITEWLWLKNSEVNCVRVMCPMFSCLLARFFHSFSFYMWQSWPAFSVSTHKSVYSSSECVIPLLFNPVLLQTTIDLRTDSLFFLLFTSFLCAWIQRKRNHWIKEVKKNTMRKIVYNIFQKEFCIYN